MAVDTSDLLEPDTQVSYGFNNEAGKYLDVGDAKIYYEVYGTGDPILLLHGGMFGYIDEYKDRIPALSKDHQVIAIATRGHGKSELGTKPLSYDLFAEDAAKILRKESQQKATLIGFSDGAIISLVFGSKYPDLTRKIVSLAGGFGSAWFHQEALKSMKDLTGESLKKDYPGFVKSRVEMMPEPERWDEFIRELNKVNRQSVFLTDAAARKITCPVLVLGGDRDDYFRPENFTHVHQTLPNSKLVIVPECDHLSLMQKETVFEEHVLPFVLEKES